MLTHRQRTRLLFSNVTPLAVAHQNTSLSHGLKQPMRNRTIKISCDVSHRHHIYTTRGAVPQVFRTGWLLLSCQRQATQQLPSSKSTPPPGMSIWLLRSLTVLIHTHNYIFFYCICRFLSTKVALAYIPIAKDICQNNGILNTLRKNKLHGQK